MSPDVVTEALLIKSPSPVQLFSGEQEVTELLLPLMVLALSGLTVVALRQEGKLLVYRCMCVCVFVFSFLYYLS